MVTMRHWRMNNTSTASSVVQPQSNVVTTLITKVFDPLEGTSKQFECSNQSIYQGPMIKKTPSTPECEEVLAELRKKYYNPREGSSKQYVETTTLPIKLEPTMTFPTLHLLPQQIQQQQQQPESVTIVKEEPKEAPVQAINEAEIELKAKRIHQAYMRRYNLPKQEPNATPETGQSMLELLRKCIQYAFDQEVDVIIKKFLQQIFVPATQRIKEIHGENSITDDVLLTVCCSLLDNAKAQYFTCANSLLNPINDTNNSPFGANSSLCMSSTMNPSTPSDLALSLSTATTPKMELSETESDNSLNFSSTSGCGSILQQALKGDRSYETDPSEYTETTTEDEHMADEISDDLLGKIAEEISEEDLSQAFSFEDSLLSDIPCFSLSPPPLMDALSSNDFKVPLPPISTITSSLSKPYVPFSSLFGNNAEPCLDFIDFDLE